MPSTRHRPTRGRDSRRVKRLPEEPLHTMRTGRPFQDGAVARDDPVLVGIPARDAAHDAFPDTGFVAAHDQAIRLAVPRVPVADHRNARGVRRPDAEACRIVGQGAAQQRMQRRVRAFAKQVHILFAELGLVVHPERRSRRCFDHAIRSFRPWRRSTRASQRSGPIARRLVQVRLPLPRASSGRFAGRTGHAQRISPVSCGCVNSRWHG